MHSAQPKFTPTIPKLNLLEDRDMLTDFSREAQRHLISARNSLLVLETVATDKEALENIFKTFHTIKGLSDFLTLDDIYTLAQESENLMDLLRKDTLHFEGETAHLITKAINTLQRLLELLDEQIENGGELKSKYLDIGKLIESLKKITTRQTEPRAKISKTANSMPTISVTTDMSICVQLQEQMQADAHDTVTFEKALINKFINDFQETSRELKELQSKLVERQRELIKERELAIKLTQKAQDEARAKSEYLANMSHEIRTLINAILGFTELLKVSDLDRKQKEHVNTIILSGKMLLEIVNHILDFSKVESGKLKLESVDFNLEYIIEEVFKIIRTRLTNKPIRLSFTIKDEVPRNLIGDPTRLKQIFINLLDNAIKFTEKGEIHMDVKLEKASPGPELPAHLKFSVRDTGIGIPADRHKVIFESFAQAHDSTTRLYGGTGLGLALCKTFVETMGGQIWVESEMGQGSTFVFTVQLQESPIQLKRREAPDFAEYQGTRVMVVDNYADSAKGLKALCEKLQLKVLPIAKSAKQASEQLLGLEEKDQIMPAIIFIDVTMPDKEGFMLAYKIRQQERYREIKLVAISSDVNIDSSDEYKHAGFNHFLAKPIIKGEVMDAIRRLLGDQLPRGRIISSDTLQKISCEGVRVLVVEDSLPNQELLRVHFESLKCVCDYVINGKEAIEMLKKNKYDICFMDLQMPVMGGLEATKIIRQEMNLDMPIVALTAAEFQEEKDRCYELGMNDYLPKPFGLEQLKEKIITCTKM